MEFYNPFSKAVMFPGDTKRRKLIVDLIAPRYASWPYLATFNDSRADLESIISPELFNDFKLCNVDQQKAIMMALSAQDYSLWLGMPGTGKV